LLVKKEGETKLWGGGWSAIRPEPPILLIQFRGTKHLAIEGGSRRGYGAPRDCPPEKKETN